MTPRRILENFFYWLKTFRNVFIYDDYKVYDVLTDTKTGGQYLILSTSVIPRIIPAGSMAERLEGALPEGIAPKYRALLRSVTTGAYITISYNLMKRRQKSGLYTISMSTKEQMEKWFGEQPVIREMTMGNGQLHVSLAHEFSSKVFARAFGETLQVHDAENYLETTFITPQGDYLTVTTQRHNKKTPHMLRKEAEDKLAAAEARIRELEGGAA